MTIERDTHFAGWAELLYQELSALEGSHEIVISEYRNKYDKQKIIQLLAQRAYDLVTHACSQLGNAEYELRYWPSEQVIDEYIPDLTAWPEPPKT